mgnify:CR=1 FL=1
MSADRFSIPTLDGRTVLRGQVDWPDPWPRGAGRLPLLLIVPGGGFMDRDGQLGDSGSERDLVFRDLAAAATAAGIAALRWDSRGISCSGLTMPVCAGSATAEEGMQHFIDHCIDEPIRGGVTPENLLSDIEQVAGHAAHHPQIDPDRVVVWAHSEGTMNAARLVQAGRLVARGLVLVAPVIESPRASQWWLDVGRVVAAVMAWDADGDGRVSDADVRAGHPADVLFQMLGTPLEELLPDGDHWTAETLRARLDRRHADLASATLAADDAAPFAFPAVAGMPSPVYASFRWRKQWFRDDLPVIDLLTDFPGRIGFHFGAIDCQNPVARQVHLLAEKMPAFRRAPTWVVHPDRGHTLRAHHPLLGPLDREARDRLVQDVLAMLA